MPTEPAEIWEAVLEDLATRDVQEGQIELWLRPCRPVAIEDNRLVVVAPSMLFGWIGMKYRKRLGDIVRSISTLDGFILREHANPRLVWDSASSSLTDPNPKEEPVR